MYITRLRHGKPTEEQRNKILQLEKPASEENLIISFRLATFLYKRKLYSNTLRRWRDVGISTAMIIFQLNSSSYDTSKEYDEQKMVAGYADLGRLQSY